MESQRKSENARQRKATGQPSIRGVIDRIEDGKVAVILLDDGQRLLWPASNLPAGAKEGAAIVLSLDIDVKDTERRLDRTKELLKDIFTE